MTRTDKDLRFIGHVDRDDGTRFVVRRHAWGFSETLLRKEDDKWKTLHHAEYHFTHDLKETS